MTLQAPGEHVSGSAASRFAYDVFVVHADAAADEAFVNGYLLPRLGLAPERVRRCQTLELGQFIAEEIERGVRSSRVTIVVLSAAYMDDHWVAFGEQLAAYASVAKDVHGVLLPLLREGCKLTMHVQSLVKLDFRDPSRALWDAEIDRLRAYLDRPAAAGADLPCPYPGMRPFTEDDVGRFFGREVELDNIVYRLRQGEREIYVIGPSGSGKSSLIAAGLVPRLTKGVEGYRASMHGHSDRASGPSSALPRRSKARLPRSLRRSSRCSRAMLPPRHCSWSSISSRSCSQPLATISVATSLRRCVIFGLTHVACWCSPCARTSMARS